MTTYEKITERARYKKVCPFCKSVCENFKGSNLFCNCSAKYYYFDKVWLNRNTGEEIWESEKKDDN